MHTRKHHSLSRPLHGGLGLIIASTLLMAACAGPAPTVSETHSRARVDGSGAKSSATGSSGELPIAFEGTPRSHFPAPNTDSPGASPVSAALSSEAPTTIATSNHRGGTRLHFNLLETAEGFQAWQGWHDSALGEDCSFERDENGILRCFPQSSTEQMYYSNAVCTRGIVPDDAADPSRTAHYMYVKARTTCGEGIRAYHVGESIDTPAVVYERNGATCVAVTPPAGSFRALGAPVDPTAFVAADYGAVESRGRVVGYGLRADDGAVQITGFIDRDLNTACAWRGLGVASCVPVADPIDRFSDPGLSQPLMANRPDTCSDSSPTVGATFDANACSTHYYTRGARFDGDTVYGQLPQVGSGISAIAATETYYRTAGEITVGDMARGLLESAPPETHLIPFYFATPDRTRWFSNWYDTSLSVNCSFRTASDGSQRCLPNADGMNVVYQDADCSSPVGEATINQCDSDGEPSSFAVEQGADEAINVRRVLDATSLTSVYVKSDTGTCVAHPSNPNKRYFELSDPMPSDAFVLGTPEVFADANDAPNIPSQTDRSQVSSGDLR